MRLNAGDGADRYELRSAIGKGAFGTVWDAWDHVLGRRVAIKTVTLAGKKPIEVEDLLDRFRREAQVGSRLAHGGAVSVYDYGESEGVAFIVMEFVAGETLHAELRRVGRLAPARACAIMKDVLAALEHCHRRGIIHRDLKPANIMLPQEGGVKLADFGIARIEGSEMTTIGTVLGTPPYMSPEQWTAQQPVDVPSDLWSCGVVLHEMLTGQLPFGKESRDAIREAVLNRKPELPSRLVPGLPPELDDVVTRALRKEPARRFASAEAFAAALPAGFEPPVTKRQGGSRLVLIGGAAVLAVLAAAAGGWLWWSGRHETADLAAPLAALPCSSVALVADAPAGTRRLRGIIGQNQPRQALDALLAAQPGQTDVSGVQSFPATEMFCRLAELGRRHAGRPGPGGARLATANGHNTLTYGQELRLDLRMPDFAGEVRLDDFGSDGSVAHMMELNLGAPARALAGAQIGLGRQGDDLVATANRRPGTDVVLAVVTSERLLPPVRSSADAEQFVAQLAAALDALEARGGRAAVDAQVLTTNQR